MNCALMREDAARRESRFEALVLRQSRFVFRVANAILRNPFDAEDVVQETFLKLYRAGAWDSIVNERGFLARIAWRAAIDKLPRKSEALDPASASHGASPEETVIWADWSAAVHRLIDALPEELRQPLALSSVDEMNSREIAEVMGISEGTVRTRLMRARKMVKLRLANVRSGRSAK